MTAKKRSIKKYILVILAIFTILYGPTIFMPIISPYYIPGVYHLECFIEEHGRMPSSEDEYSQWVTNNYPSKSNTFQFNFIGDIAVDDLEVRDDQLVYKESGELCRLIYGGKSNIDDILFRWKYDRVSIMLFELLKEVKDRDSEGF